MTPNTQRSVMPGIWKELVGGAFALALVAAYFMQLLMGFQLAEAILVGGLMGFFAGGATLLFCYIYGDARRRNMNAALWVALAVIAPSGIGIILYFLLRDPIAANCAQCGSPADARFAYCPQCGASLAAIACPQCHRVPQPGWTHCAACGTKL